MMLSDQDRQLLYLALVDMEQTLRVWRLALAGDRSQMFMQSLGLAHTAARNTDTELSGLMADALMGINGVLEAIGKDEPGEQYRFELVSYLALESLIQRVRVFLEAYTPFIGQELTD